MKEEFKINLQLFAEDDEDEDEKETLEIDPIDDEEKEEKEDKKEELLDLESKTMETLIELVKLQTRKGEETFETTNEVVASLRESLAEVKTELNAVLLKLEEMKSKEETHETPPVEDKPAKKNKYARHSRR